MRRLWPVVFAALLAAPAPAGATIRVVDLRSGHVRTLAGAPLAWRGHTLIAADAGRSGLALRRYPGGRRLLRLPGASRVAVGGRWVAAVAGGSRHTDRVVVRRLAGGGRAARTFGGLVDSLAWSRDGTRLAVGWTAHADLHSHLTILTRDLKTVRTLHAASSVTMSTAGWSPDGRTLTYATDAQRLGASGGPRPGEVRSLNVAGGRRPVLLRGTRCDLLHCELLGTPAATTDGRIALVRDFAGVTLLRRGAAQRALALPSGCTEVDAVAWAGPALATVYLDGRKSKLALLRPGRRPRTIATFAGGVDERVLVSGRRAAVYQR